MQMAAEHHLKSTELGHLSPLYKMLKSLLENRTRNHPYGFIKQFPESLLHIKHSNWRKLHLLYE